MLCAVMPGGKNSDISYRVKCVAVESERIFGDIVVTRQSRDLIYLTNASLQRPTNSSRRKICNLTKQILEIPDFMALNRKPLDRELSVEFTKILPFINERTNSIWNNVDGKIVDNADDRRLEKKQRPYPLPMLRESASQEVVVTSLVDQLLLDIYGYPRSERGRSESDSTVSSYKPPPQHRYLRGARLLRKSSEELSVVLETLGQHVNHAGGLLIRQLRRRDYLVAKRDKQYDVITAHLQAYSAKRSEDTRMRFSLTPQPGESGFTQWLDAMKMVARLQGGIPQEFRKRLWLTLAERHLDQRGVDWKQAEKLCFNEWSNPDDEELGIQIVKDLHRTGCSLFCGAAGRDNQAVLRRVLLGFARWNKSVGYCQGLNVLAAFVLQVTDRAESSAVKVMIYLIEGVLPEGYFADNLRGLSIDMAVFRDLLRIRLPKLSRHLEALQSDAKDKATGSSYEPPLTNVFTMQWFLTLFCHCLPQEAVLRVWDLIFLEGDEVLLRTALAIWEGISDRIMTVKSADEFYSIMGVLTREMLEFTDVNNLIKTIVNMGPLYGVTDLREKHRYNITPWARRLSDEEETDTEDEERLAVAAAMFGVPQRFKKDRLNASSSVLQTIGATSDRERLALDISTLKHQYAKLRERQRQAHIILSAACARQSMVPSSTSQAMNHLLVGKSALVSAKTRQLGPPPGAIPPKPRVTATLHATKLQSGRRDKQGVTLHWKDTKKSKDESDVGDETETSSGIVDTTEIMSSTLTSPKRGSANDSDSDSTSTELCDEPDRLSDVDSEEPTSTSDCYVMATDDEKSPRTGASPIIGSTSLRSEKNLTLKRDNAYLDVGCYENDDTSNSGKLSLAEETSSSIAMITDQIRRLSASDENNLSPINLPESSSLTLNKAVKDVDRVIDETISRNDTFGEIATTIDEKFVASSIISETEEPDQAHTRVEEKNFQMLDRYDFLISTDKPEIAEKLINPTVSLVDKYCETIVKEVSVFGTDNDASIVDATRDSGTVDPNVTCETTLSASISGLNEDIFSYRSAPINLESDERKKLESTDLQVSHCSNYQDLPSTMVSSVGDRAETIIGERTFYSRSYVIGHLPISPATVNEKLNRAAEISPLTENIGILSTEIGSFDAGTGENVDTSFDTWKIVTSSEPTNTPKLSTRNVSSNDNVETRLSYQFPKSIDSNSSMKMSTCNRVPDTLVLFDKISLSNDNIGCLENSIAKDTTVSLVIEPQVVDPLYSDESLFDSPKNVIDEVESLNYDVPKKIGTFSAGSLISPLREDRANLTDVKRSTTATSPSVNDANTSGKNSTYVYQDSMSMKIYEDKKMATSPRTPESVKSFSSGETMGPDSKTSSMATSPRSLTARTDMKNFPPHERSERSSLSSDSKTLTICSLESEIVGNGGTRLDSRSNVTREYLEKSSPSTPISTDSLMNKYETSPKFFISSSSESCSTGKANKSSERSFSSELRSPVSANSIKYRKSYVEGQDNLSESPMDICSATSPFYPIVNPNQKTPSPYGTTLKQTVTSGNSPEISPEQKLTCSGEEKNFTKYSVNGGSLVVGRSSDVVKSSKDKDDYDSGRPFEKELAETLSCLPSERTKNDRTTKGRYKNDADQASYRTSKKTTIAEIEEIDELYVEMDIVSPLPSDKYEENRAACAEKSGSFKGITATERDDKYSSSRREKLKPFERSSSSLDKRFGERKSSASSDEFSINTHKKRSSDILQDLKHLEEKTLKDGKTDTSMLTRKTGYVWEDLKNLEARRQDNFSDSASEFSLQRLEPSSRTNIYGEARKSYVVEPRINLEVSGDSILKSYARKKSNGEPDDDRESKLGVWTKVKPRACRDSGRRSSDRALKIIQENSAILHKILTCQAKKRLPDLEEISNEITISPINEEISKIFSPILEKMGLNEDEINEELARINFKDFDQMTTASGSEFDAKINDELSKLSLIDDTEIVDRVDIDDVISRDYLDTRESLIDRQINEELSKLLANYEIDSPICIAGNRDEASSCQNPSEIEGLDISSISTNVFSYQSSNESIETKSDHDSMQDTRGEKFSHYNEDTTDKFVESSKYKLRGVSPRSDIDIYRELEKLDKISSGEILPSSSSVVAQKIISPISYISECPVYPEVRSSMMEYSVKPENTYETVTIESPYDTYKPYEFKSRISPRKTPGNPYSARSYEKPMMNENFDFNDDPATTSRLYDLVDNSRPILSKETLEFRVRYDDEEDDDHDNDETSKVMRNNDLGLKTYHASLVNFDRGASYYTNEPTVSLKLSENDKSLEQATVSPIDCCSYGRSDFYVGKYDSVPSNSYSYVKSTTDYENTYKIGDNTIETDSYISLERENFRSHSPNYHYDDCEFDPSLNNPYSMKFSQSLDEAATRPVSHTEFSQNMSQLVKYTETTIMTTTTTTSSSSSSSLSRDVLNFRKASLSLGPLDGSTTTSRLSMCQETTSSPRSLFSPFPMRNTSRKPKELGLKLGLYSPSSTTVSNPLKRS